MLYLGKVFTKTDDINNIQMANKCYFALGNLLRSRLHSKISNILYVYTVNSNVIWVAFMDFENVNIMVARKKKAKYYDLRFTS